MLTAHSAPWLLLTLTGAGSELPAPAVPWHGCRMPPATLCPELGACPELMPWAAAAAPAGGEMPCPWFIPFPGALPALLPSPCPCLTREPGCSASPSPAARELQGDVTPLQMLRCGSLCVRVGRVRAHTCVQERGCSRGCVAFAIRERVDKRLGAGAGRAGRGLERRERVAQPSACPSCCLAGRRTDGRCLCRTPPQRHPEKFRCSVTF